MRISTVGANSKAPYTLVEVMVVLLVIALILGLALPRLGRPPLGWRVHRLRTRLNAAATTAADLALATGEPVRLRWDAGTVRTITPGRPLPTAFARLEAVPLADGAAAVGTPADLLFLPTGEAAGGPWNLSLEGRRLRLTVDPLTGACRIVEAGP